MKNIIILGPPRSGKSTFAKMILNNFKNYNLISYDVIASTILHIENLNASKENRPTAVDLSLMNEYTKQMFNFSLECEPTLNFILDSMDSIPLKEAKEYKNTIVLVFGYPDITPEEGLANTEKYDTNDDWTKTEPPHRIYQLFQTYIGYSKNLEEKCKNLNIKFINTSKNRKQTLNELLNWLKENNQ